VPSPSPRRTILFLQGPPTGYWNDLAAALRAEGVGVRRVNLCLADRLFWHQGDAVDYRGSLRGWRHWLKAYLAREAITDIVYFADRLPYHRIARVLAAQRGIAAHAIEFGYLRPDWLTLERGGNGAHSHISSTPDALREGPLPDLRPRHGHPFWQEALGEVAFNLTMIAGRPLYPRYVMDKPIHPIPDYLAWLVKIAVTPARRLRARRTQRDILAGRPFWLVGLQLPVDYQLRDGAYFADQRAMVDAVVASFARAAPRDHALVFKAHPLDNGWVNWSALAARAARRLGLADRVRGIDGGDLGALVTASEGVVVANSTVGLQALRAGKPVKTLGAAVYDMPGLTAQEPLDAFWQSPPSPDPALVHRLIATLVDEVQVRGSFYERAGRRLAAAEMARRIAAGTVGPATPVNPPPRLAGLRRHRLTLAAQRRGASSQA
jgi:capsular polysaccharide export protein